MNETLALLISGASIIGSIGFVFSMKSKYAKLSKDFEEKQKKDIQKQQEDEIKSVEKKSILIVDDSIVIRTKMKKLLIEAGYDVTLANDGADALNVLPTKNFDLIITDLEMPNVDGFEFISKVNENPETKEIPVIIITGHEEIHVKISESENLAGIQKKPWKEPEFLQKVKFLCSLTK